MSGKMKPSSTSTPDRFARISARPSVHDQNSYLSPILKPNNSPAVGDDSEDEENSEEDSSSKETRSNEHLGLGRSSSKHSERERSASERDGSLSYHHTSEDSRQCKSGSKISVSSLSNINCSSARNESNAANNMYMWVTAVLGVILTLVCVSLGTLSFEPIKLSIPDLKVLFPSQSEDLWNAVESGVEDVKRFNKPSVFLILYKPSTEETLHRMVEEITKYSSCVLNNNCEIKPIILKSDRDLHTYSDYGSLISKYKNELADKAVMVVHNLDEIPGHLAQAFHSMCDEYNPLVNKAVFFFTIKITDPHAKTSDLRLVEEILKDKWSDLHDDIFNPLFTRISSMVLNIAPEV